MRLATLFSGGKDSSYAAYKAQQAGHTVKHLVSVYPQNESYMYHVPNIHLVELISQSMNIPLTIVEAPDREDELEPLKMALSKLSDIDGVVSGAVASEYQRSRFKQICDELALELLTPLWGADPEKVLRDMLLDGFKVMIVGCYAMGLDETWLGRIIDDETVDELVDLHRKYGIHILGEGGEIETIVLNAPNMRQELQIIDGVKKWYGDSGELIITGSLLQEKSE